MTESIPSGVRRSSSPVAGTSRLDKIHEEIAWHQAQIAMLKAEANSLCTILNLPTEIVSQIFHWYALGSNRCGDVRWTKIMSVCRRWHDIALADQEIWGFIHVTPFSSIPDIDRRLQRSGSAPLIINIEDVDLTPSLAGSHVSRLRDISLAGVVAVFAPFTDLILGHAFPILRTVTLQCTGRWEREWALPDALFDGRAPQLTALHLVYVSVNWDLLRGLTSLALVGLSATFEVLLSVLRANSVLERLNISDVINPASANQSLPIACLPVIKLLHLTESVFATTLILRHITFPAATRLTVDGLDISTGSGLTDLLDQLRRHLRAPGAPAAACLRLDFLEPLHTFIIRTYAAASAPTMYTSSATEEDESIFAFGAIMRKDNLIRRVTTRVLKLLPRTRITYLDARAASLTITSWRAVLALLPALDVVHTGVSPEAGQLLQALAQLCDASTGRYPRLRRIRLSLSPWGMQSFGEGSLEHWFGVLRDLVNTAHAHDLQLDSVEIEDPVNALTELPWSALFNVVGTILLNSEVLH
ncbi:hypothetical protein C8R46DRAFT_1095692 [Mycena filopes]|nr:hypothetical protein C8R46DRAFT_1095692 [Mycena filopes]